MSHGDRQLERVLRVGRGLDSGFLIPFFVGIAPVAKAASDKLLPPPSHLRASVPIRFLVESTCQRVPSRAVSVRRTTALDSEPNHAYCTATYSLNSATHSLNSALKCPSARSSPNAVVPPPLHVPWHTSYLFGVNPNTHSRRCTHAIV